jgi:hypothetical protein
MYIMASGLLCAVVVVGCIDTTDHGSKLIGMLQCRSEFVTTLKTITDTSQSLWPGQKLELVMKAVMRRQDCEQEILK